MYGETLVNDIVADPRMNAWAFALAQLDICKGPQNMRAAEGGAEGVEYERTASPDHGTVQAAGMGGE